jgi:hypothetical protein
MDTKEKKAQETIVRLQKQMLKNYMKIMKSKNIINLLLSK